MQSLIVFIVFGKLDMDSKVDNKSIYSICRRNLPDIERSIYSGLFRLV